MIKLVLEKMGCSYVSAAKVERSLSHTVSPIASTLPVVLFMFEQVMLFSVFFFEHQCKSRIRSAEGFSIFPIRWFGWGATFFFENPQIFVESSPIWRAPGSPFLSLPTQVWERGGANSHQKIYYRCINKVRKLAHFRGGGTVLDWFAPGFFCQNRTPVA